MKYSKLDFNFHFSKMQKGPPIADLISLFGSKDSIKRIRKGVEQLSQISSTPKSASVRD